MVLEIYAADWNRARPGDAGYSEAGTNYSVALVRLGDAIWSAIALVVPPGETTPETAAGTKLARELFLQARDLDRMLAEADPTPTLLDNASSGRKGHRSSATSRPLGPGCRPKGGAGMG